MLVGFLRIDTVGQFADLADAELGVVQQLFGNRLPVVLQVLDLLEVLLHLCHELDLGRVVSRGVRALWLLLGDYRRLCHLERAFLGL